MLPRRKSFTSVIFPDSLPDEVGSWSNIDFLTANKKSLYLNRAINRRAEKVGEIDFVLKRGDKIIENDPRLMLLYRPNKIHTGAEFWSLFQKHKDITGSAYIWMKPSTELFDAKRVTELHLLQPDLVTKVFDPVTNTITKYILHKNGGEAIPYDASEIIYSFYPDPAQPIDGESLIRAGIRQIMTEQEIVEYHAKILKNGGKVDSVFKFKTTQALTKLQLAELKKDYEDQYASAKHSGKPLFLGGDAEYIKMGLTPDEMAYLETKKMTLDDICLMTGVPKAILAITSGETFSNADASIGIFLRETIKPLLKNLTEKLNLGLFPEQDLELTFIDPTPEDVDKKLKVLETANTINAMTINEKREALELEPIENGDDILVPFSLTPLGQGGYDFGNEEKPAEEDPTDEEDDKQDNDQQEKTIKTAHPLRDKELRKRYGELYLKRFDRREREFLRLVNSYFKEQRERLVSKLDVGQTRQFRRKDLLNEIFNITAEVKIARDKFLPFLEKVLKESGLDALEMIGSRPNFVISDSIQSWLTNRTDKFAKQINDTTFEKLKSEFANSLEAGESRQQLIGRVQNTYQGISEARATTIARTEIQGASQKGTFEGYKQGGMGIKIWVATLDSSTRDSHASLDGQERPIDMPFANGLQYPGDPSGSADEVINCRCTI